MCCGVNMPVRPVMFVKEKKEVKQQGSGKQQQKVDEHDHDHTGDDPHIWMAPLLVKRQAQTMRDTLSRLDPAGKASYAANYQKLAAELDQLHERIKAQLKPVRGQAILVFHPSFGYFTDAYGMRQLVVESEGKAPSPRQLSRLIAEVKKRKIKTVFVQPQFDQSSARVIAAAIGGNVESLDPLSKDYPANLEQIAKKIRKALERKTP